MTDHRLEGPGEHPDPVPRDMPDQQAHEGEDPWEAAPGHAGGDERDEGRAPEGADVPDTDEAGTGPQGEPRSGAVHPEQPVPDEPSD
ncbi:hypothetical protein [Streptomyces scabiei]|uniref:hypothetical protein n=1 Tax=Streptomyces scabiei TaxID=1930 RepID=UPI0029A31057|nr:hypothetical protein [Streptomyces scabiei]MDX3523476.1 hypothetical protein [Streptomyces scabiei]